jgi:hypothetical protein
MLKKLFMILGLMLVASMTYSQVNSSLQPPKTKGTGFNSLNSGISFMSRSKDHFGFMVFTEYQIKLNEKIFIAPRLYHGRSYYQLGHSKGDVYTIQGVALRIDYSIFKNNHWKALIGAGYTFRHIDEIWRVPSFGFENPQSAEPRYRRFVGNNGCPVLNLNIERKINERISIGVNSEWQPGGMYNSILSTGIYTSVKF